MSNQISEMVDKMCNAQFERGVKEGKKQALTSEIEFLENELRYNSKRECCYCSDRFVKIKQRIAELKGALLE